MQGTLTKGEGSVQLTSMHLLVLISGFLYCLLFYCYFFTFFYEQASLVRRSTVLLILPLQLVFPDFMTLSSDVYYKTFLAMD
jgi:hypothetical protein